MLLLFLIKPEAVFVSHHHTGIICQTQEHQVFWGIAPSSQEQVLLALLMLLSHPALTESLLINF